MSRKILIMGLPRAGKTMLAHALVPLLRAVHFDAGDRHGGIGKNPGFAPETGIDLACHMGWLCDRVAKAGHYAIADFACPTPETRAAFGDAYTIYLNIGQPTSYVGRRAGFVPPDKVDYEIREQNAEHHAKIIARHLAAAHSGFDWRKPTALFVGSCQPFDDNHRMRVLERLARVGQVCIAVRDTEDVDAKNPYGFMTIRDRIEIMLADHLDKIAIIGIPNITDVSHDRDIGRVIEDADLPAVLQAAFADGVRAGCFVETINAEEESATA